MIPPVTGPVSGAKPSASLADTTQNTQQSQRVAPSGSTGEDGPSQIKPDTRQAIQPTRQFPTSERLRSSSPDGSDLIENLPAGPPPAFVETLLERQARQAFEAPDDKPSSGTTDREFDPARGAYDTARDGFEKARGAAEPPAPTKIDLKE